MKPQPQNGRLLRYLTDGTPVSGGGLRSFRPHAKREVILSSYCPGQV